ncbi:MAG: hypothetical protein JHC74_09170 [Thermoleophilia bacterium]|nr:hypothetical protein [Thermoleophilia bacterium]
MTGPGAVTSAARMEGGFKIYGSGDAEVRALPVRRAARPDILAAIQSE